MTYVPPDFTPPPVPVTPPSPPADLGESQYYSQFCTDTVGILILPNGSPVDADGSVSVSGHILASPGTTTAPAPSWTAVATHSAVGTYTYSLNPSVSSNLPGFYRLDWSYSLSGLPVVRSTYIQIGPPSPVYDALPQIGRQIVNDVWARFADGFDSSNGGPNLQMWYQTHFNRGRVAQLLRQTIQYINVRAQPAQVFSADGTDGPLFPYQQWQGLVNAGLTVEVVKHLIRSYTEDPTLSAGTQARLDRTSYQQRWMSVLQIEEQTFKGALDVWKINFMFRMTPRVLVSGGAFGNYGPVRMIGNLAARPAFMWRFY